MQMDVVSVVETHWKAGKCWLGPRLQVGFHWPRWIRRTKVAAVSASWCEKGMADTVQEIVAKRTRGQGGLRRRWPDPRPKAVCGWRTEMGWLVSVEAARSVQ